MLAYDERTNPFKYRGVVSEGQLVSAARQVLFDAMNERSGPDRYRSDFTAEQIDAAKFVLTSMIAEPE